MKNIASIIFVLIFISHYVQITNYNNNLTEKKKHE